MTMKVNTPDLSGKVALVTGGAKRTGRVLSLKLAAAGAAVVVNAHTSKAQAEATAREIEAAGGRAMPYVADVGDPAAVRAMVDAAVERLGGLDILINNASIRFHAAFEDTKFEDWKRILRVSLDGSFFCAQAAAPHLVKSGEGTVINIGGVVSHTGTKGASAIMAAKAGVEGLTRALAYELGPRVTVNCVVPASMLAPDDAPDRARTLNAFYQHQNVPLGRPGTVEEVASAVVDLCGPQWRYMTGQMVHINGGVYFGA